MSKDVKKAIQRRINTIKESAEAATPGHWRRNHGVLTSSIYPSADAVRDYKEGRTTKEPKTESYVIALVDSRDTAKVKLHLHEPDMLRAWNNARYMEATNPKTMMELILLVEELLRETENSC